MEKTKVKRFSDQMLIELQHNSHKGSVLDWTDFDNMIMELEYHKSKMMLAIRGNDRNAIKEYIADCGNILLGIGNLFGLYDEETEDNGMCSETEKIMFKQVPISEKNTSVTHIIEKAPR